MGKRAESPVKEHRKAVLSLLRREEPGSGYCPSLQCVRGVAVPLA